MYGCPDNRALNRVLSVIDMVDRDHGTLVPL